MKSLLKTLLPKALWTQLRLLRIQCGIKFYPSRVVSHVYGNITLSVWIKDPQAQSWYDHDWLELPEFVLLKCGRLKPGARVFDIGSHQCVVALQLASIVGNEGYVLALDPNLHNISVGEENRELNGVDQLSIIHGAIASTSGVITVNKTLNAQVEDGSKSWGTMVVPSFSIDDLSQQYGLPDVLFIDVEGFECHALAGAGNTLRDRPDCFVEVHVGTGLEKFGSVHELLSFFPAENFKLFVRAEDEENFKELLSKAEIPSKRFFLVALGKK